MARRPLLLPPVSSACRCPGLKRRPQFFRHPAIRRTACPASFILPIPYKLSVGNPRLGAQRGVDFLISRPPVRALDLGDALAGDIRRRLHLVGPAGVGPKELGPILLWQPVFLHRLNRAPDVVAVMW